MALWQQPIGRYELYHVAFRLERHDTLCTRHFAHLRLYYSPQILSSTRLSAQQGPVDVRLMDFAIEVSTRDVTAGAAPPEDWLADVIRNTLRAWVADAEPSPEVWTWIRYHIGATTLSVPYARRHIMFPSDKDFRVAQERYKDLLREAQRHRLVQQSFPDRRKRHYLSHRVLSWLGRRLVAWGQHLQERHGATPEAPPLQPADHTR